MAQQSDLIVAKGLLADKRISVTARLLLGFLLDHRNKKTGQCNPRRKTLARELGVSLRSIVRALNELRKAGFIRSKQGQHTAFYEIQECQFGTPQPGSGVPSWHTKEGQFGTPGPATPLYEPIEVEPAARARKRACRTTAAAADILRKDVGREDGTLSIVRASLEDLAPRVHMPPPDEDLVRKVVDAAHGAPGENIHATLVALFKRGRFSEMRSWGLVPVLIDACFQPPDRAALR